MANYAKIRRDAVLRRRALRDDLARARESAKECEREIAVLDQIIGALRGVGGAGGAKRGRPAGKGKRRKGGKWRPGRPGRPPNWWLEQQKAKRADGRKKRRGRKPGRRRRAAASKPAVASSPAASMATG